PSGPTRTPAPCPEAGAAPGKDRRRRPGPGGRRRCRAWRLAGAAYPFSRALIEGQARGGGRKELKHGGHGEIGTRRRRHFSFSVFSVPSVFNHFSPRLRVKQLRRKASMTDIPTFVTHLECGWTGERVAADRLHNLSPQGYPLLVRYDLAGVA